MIESMILCDYSWMLHRFAWVHRDLSVKIKNKEFPSGHIYGFTNFIESVYKRIQKPNIVFCLDSKSEERKALYEDYKGNRESKEALHDDIATIHSILCGTPFVSFAHALGKEADDLLAQLAFEFKDSYNLTVYSGDNDMLQLKAKGIKVAKEFGKDGFKDISEDYIRSKYNGIDSKLLIYFRAIVGDPSDNIKPVAKFLKRKKVVEFITLWQRTSLDQAIVQFSDRTFANTINANKDILIRNLKLMSLLKYEKEKHRFKYELFRVHHNPQLIDIYKLKRYKAFLGHLNNANNNELHASSGNRRKVPIGSYTWVH